MARVKFQTLTEQMFYILLCLRQECCGMDILDRVPDMTGGRVSVGSGTLYNLLEQFTQEGFIRETRVEGRKRSYVLTDRGRAMLDREYARLNAQARDYRAIFGEDGL
ncbi:MAG: PadR family transcriptional regulator [Eubacteriales bacterium]|nr:PadR family transcriptional regulator [Eubacteriales bacterium]